MRKEIKEFAEEMERVMQENDAIKRNSWKNLPISYLEHKLIEEYQEWYLLSNIKNNKKELIDIANICMMLWHRYKEE